MKFSTLVIVVCALLLSDFALGQSLVRGPYLQTGTPTAVTIKWRTSSASNTQVWYGTSLSNLQAAPTINNFVTDHEYTLQNLNPNTKYYYTIGKSSSQLLPPNSQMYVKTSPPHGTVQPIRAWVLGDSGNAGKFPDNDDPRDVRDAYYNLTGNQHTDMVLMLGDNAYENGTDSEYQLAMFENMYEDILRKSVVWSCIGNHDLNTSNGDPYIDIFSFPKNGEAGGMASSNEKYYSYDYGNAHFIVINSRGNHNPGSDMLNWIESDLANTTADWIIALWHHPPYSKGSHDTDNSSEYQSRKMRENVLPILEDHGVDFVMTGHSHSYERSYFLNGHYGTSEEILNNPSLILDSGSGNENTDGAYLKDITCTEGAVYSVIGSSSKVNNVSKHNAMYYWEKALGSGILEIDDNRLELTFINENGQVRDNFTIIKDDYGENCGPVTPGGETTVCRKIATGMDDAEEHLSGGYVSAFSSDLEMVYDGGIYQKAGLRFTNLSIPPGAEILEAYVQFTSKQSNSSYAPLTIIGEKNPFPTDFSGGNGNISARIETSTSVDWNPPSWGTTGESGAAQKTPDLSSIVQEVVNQNGFSENSALVLMVKGNQGTRSATSYNYSASNAPELCIRYKDGTVEPPEGVVLEVQVSDGNDDAEQNVSGGYVSLNSSDLEMTKDLSGQQTQLIGIRFSSVGLSSTDNVTKAYIKFTAKESSSGLANLTIKGEKSPNPASYQSINYLISNRSTTSSSVSWNPPGWSSEDDGADQETADITSIIQELQGQSGFSANSAMAFQISGSGTRNGYSYNGNASKSAILYIEIDEDGGPPTPTDESITVSIASGDDDVEQNSSNGYMSFSSSDLELTEDNGSAQKVGLLFRNSGLPSDAVIQNAYIQFTVDEADSESTALSIKGWKAANPSGFSSTKYFVTNLPKTNASVSWSPTPWGSEGDAGTAQRTPNLTSVVQELVDQSGFSSSSHLGFVIEGTGQRTAISRNKSASGAPKLTVEYSSASGGRKGIFSHFVIYPNPTPSQLTVELEVVGDFEEGRVAIFDLMGRSVLEQTVSLGADSFQLDTGDLPKGMYALRIRVGDYQTNKTFIKN